MILNESDKEQIKRELVERLKGEPEVCKVVIFGSFSTNPDPRDLDVAVFQDSVETYVPLATKYRLLTRPIARRIPMDILPFRAGVQGGWFLREEVLRGEVI
ncbi:MAG: nucleotidyltransferase domain-containing protein [Planctomycetota bacterium]|jgi:predicted nucleotidyltransferase